MDKKTLIVPLLVWLAVAPMAVGAACTQVAGKTYYTDGVSKFKDSACRDEMTTAELNAAVSGSSAATGSANCRYNFSRMQYTDGVAYFKDNKCTSEAANGETAPEPTVTQTVTQGQSQTGNISALQYNQLTQRIGSLEKMLASMQAIMAQILSLMAKK